MMLEVGKVVSLEGRVQGLGEHHEGWGRAAHTVFLHRGVHCVHQVPCISDWCILFLYVLIPSTILDHHWYCFFSYIDKQRNELICLKKKSTHKYGHLSNECSCITCSSHNRTEEDPGHQGT